MGVKTFFFRNLGRLPRSFVHFFGNDSRGMSVLEVLVGIVLFVLLFTYIMSAFAPTATDYQGMVKGFTTAVIVAEWYVNYVEGVINLEGGLPSSVKGLAKDVTTVCSQKFKEAMTVDLKNAKVISQVYVPNPNDFPNLVHIKVTVTWKGRGVQYHVYTMERYKTIPRI